VLVLTSYALAGACNKFQFKKSSSRDRTWQSARDIAIWGRTVGANGRHPQRSWALNGPHYKLDFTQSIRRLNKALYRALHSVATAGNEILARNIMKLGAVIPHPKMWGVGDHFFVGHILLQPDAHFPSTP
jgi:hypothetical protein